MKDSIIWLWGSVPHSDAKFELGKFKFVRQLGTWIAEWSSHLTFEHRYAMPWAMSSSLGDIKLFFPSTTSMLYSWFYLVCLIWYYYLSVKFVMWIVKQKIENKRNLFIYIDKAYQGKVFQLSLWIREEIPQWLTNTLLMTLTWWKTLLVMSKQ